jgi:hypothetical protein
VRTRRLPSALRSALVGLVVAVLTIPVAASLAAKQFGVTLSLDGLRRITPLGTPPDVPKGLGTFAYLATQPRDGGRPVAYDPCRTIRYEVNDRSAPAGTDRLVEQALRETSSATGLVFEYVGRTDRLPDREPTSLRPQSRPVVIAWASPDQVPELDGPVAGIGGSAAHEDSYTGDLRYVTGMVALDAPQLADVLSRPDGDAQVRAIVMHELAHLVGLDHVEDPNELMHAENSGRVDFGPGDREGLAALGSGRCYT